MGGWDEHGGERMSRVGGMSLVGRKVGSGMDGQEERKEGRLRLK